MQLFSPENNHCAKRIEYFLRYKNVAFQRQKSHIFALVFDDGKKITDPISMLREIEYSFPHPIGFIGPVEAKLQWASMILAKTPGFSEIQNQKKLDAVWEANIIEILQEIGAMVEDEYFVMGPTFSVADCVLAADLEVLQNTFSAFPPILSAYIARVHQKLG